MVWQGSAGDRRPYADHVALAENDPPVLFTAPPSNGHAEFLTIWKATDPERPEPVKAKALSQASPVALHPITRTFFYLPLSLNHLPAYPAKSTPLAC